MNERNNLLIFLDNSNLWIEGKKEFFRTNPNGDSRWRLNVGSLFQAIKGDRNISEKPCIFGSIPPPVDTFWDSFRAEDTFVNVSQKDSWNRKEKVDAKINVAITRTVTLMESDEESQRRNVIVLVTGHSDYVVCIENALEHTTELHFEVWSWRDSISKEFEMWALEKRPRFTLHYLDSHLDKIGKVGISWDIPMCHIPIDRTLLFEDYESHIEKVKTWLAKLPVPVYRYRLGEMKQDLAIIFHKKFPDNGLDIVIESARKAVDHCGVVTFIEWQRNAQCASDERIELWDTLGVLGTPSEVEESNPPNSNASIENREHKESANNQEDTWFRISRYSLVRGSSKMPAKRCAWGFYCKNFNERKCWFQHTKEEIEYFETLGPKKLRKFKDCSKFPCMYASVPEKCEFVHKHEKRLCPTCDKRTDHTMETCPYRP